MTFQEAWDKIITEFTDTASGYLPNLVGALLLLLVGWLVAFGAGGLARRGMRRSGLETRLNRWLSESGTGANVDVDRWVGRGVFWIVFLFVLVGFAATLRLAVVTEPLNELLTRVFDFIPQLIAAAVLLLVAWLAASLLKVVALRIARSIRLDERLGQALREGQAPAVPVSKTASDFIYWLVLLIFLPAVLTALALQGLLVPVQGMVKRVLDFLPNIFAAGVILVLGWLLARIVQRVTTNMLAATGADRLLERAGVADLLGQRRLSGFVGLLLYLLILIVVFIGALNALALDALTKPASDMLGILLRALPALFGAALLLGIVFVAARIVSQLVRNVLTEVGFNSILIRIGLGRELQAGQHTPSEVVGYLVFTAAMLFAVIEAAQLLRFTILADLIARFLVLTFRVVVGLVILAIGLWLANLAAAAINATQVPQRRLLALAARIALLVLVAAIALNEVGLASGIILLAFGIPLAAIGLAVAIAFGMGAREAAGREVERWISHFRGGSGS